MVQKPGQTPKPGRSSPRTSGSPLDKPVARRVSARTRPAQPRAVSDQGPHHVEVPPIQPLERLPPSPPYPPLRRLLNRARSRWNSYHLHNDLRYFRSRDTADNEGLRVPATESVIYHCLWLTEFYTPSETDEMVRRLEAMRASMKVAGDDDFAKWVKEVRGRPYSGGWHNIGYLIPRGSRRSFLGPDTLETNLPRGVAHAPASVMSLTPSLTALVVQFIFDDSVTEEWLAPLAKSYQTRAKRRLGMIRFRGPRQLKPAEAAEARRRIRARCARWIEHAVPGHFSSLPGEDNHPAVEFVTLREGMPLGSYGRLDDYLYALDLYESFDTWTLDGALRLRRGGLIEKDPRVAVLAAREDELHAWGGWKHTGHGWNRTGALIGLHDFSQFAAAVAVDALISSYEAALANTRDRLSIGKASGTDAVLTMLEGQLAGLSRGVQSIGPELVQMADSPWFVSDLGNLTWHHEAHPASDPAVDLARFYRERAEGLVSSERTVRELLVASAQVAAAHEGVRLQRVTRWIAYFSAVVAVLSLVTALGSNRDQVRSSVEALIRLLFGHP